MTGELIDITRRLHDGIPVWPGDPEFRSRAVWRLEDGAPANLSEIGMGTHTGTHLDAPLHVIPGGAGVEAFPLAALVGAARVVDFSGRMAGARRVYASDLAALDWDGVRRVIFKTSPAPPDGGGFNPEYTFLDGDAAEYLLGLGMVLVGTDAMSVDAPGTHALPAHRRLLGGGVAIVENLCLEAVAPGDYELTCLPLKLDGVDGAPVRAILRTGCGAQGAGNGNAEPLS